MNDGFAVRVQSFKQGSGNTTKAQGRRKPVCPSQSLSVGVVDDFHRLTEAHLFNQTNSLHNYAARDSLTPQIKHGQSESKKE